ncbi:MAG: YceI family protein, partial [Bacteroidota bacterium]
SVKLNVEYGGTLVDPYGQTKAGFELSGKINRKDFGLTWSAVTEAGSIVVSDEVKLLLNVQLVKQAVAETVS